MSNQKNLIIESPSGVTLRTIRWLGSTTHVVYRHDVRRLDLVSDAEIESYKTKKVKYDLIESLTSEETARNGVQLPRQHTLRLIQNEPESVAVTVETMNSEKSDKKFQILFSLLFLFGLLFQWGLQFVPAPTESIQKELERQMVKIIKPQTIEKRMTVDAQVSVSSNRQKVALKRMGALAVLGSLKSSSQKGGLNLGAVQTTRGIGLGGTQGSGGVQTSLYAKGLVAAPLGAGGNVQGAGGYGTKGKGGGQAGYGELSLVGSAGAESIGIGREAIVGGGLDKDAIAEVVRRNQGQIMFCYEQGLQADPKLAGRVAVRWVIDGQGQVKVAGIESTTLNSSLIEDCILARLRSWKFPLPQGGVDVTVTYPFQLKRAS